jgi:hypothetical protein
MTSGPSAALAEPIEAGSRYLLERQSEDGAWRDYELEPGMSEAWTTAFVGCALADPPPTDPALPALRRAAGRLHDLRRPQGWGYNAATATDADSTVWTLAFLAAVDELRDVDSLALLGPHVDPSGGVHTFLEPDRFGSWAEAHPEVTALAGVVLVALDAPRPLIELLRDRCLAWRDGGCWPSFWWATPAYSTACAVRFLRAVDALRAPERIEAWAIAQLERQPSSLELAELTRIGVDLGSRELSGAALELLLAGQREDGGWPPSRLLLVPPQRGPGEPQVAADPRGLMSTAAAVTALKAVVMAG